MRFLTGLTELAALPSTADVHFDWVTVESALGCKVPDDYRELVDSYGPGAFDGFLWLLTPSDRSLFLEIVSAQQRIVGALRVVVADGEVLPADIGSVDQLLAWAVTDNGDACFWVRVGDPSSWRVAVNAARSDDWYVFDGSATEFLYQVLTGGLEVPIFPPDFPSGAPFFDAQRPSGK